MNTELTGDEHGDLLKRIHKPLFDQLKYPGEVTYTGGGCWVPMVHENDSKDWDNSREISIGLDDVDINPTDFVLRKTKQVSLGLSIGYRGNFVGVPVILFADSNILPSLLSHLLENLY